MRTVLLVDDEPHMRELVALCLEELGAEVVLAATAEDALRSVRDEVPAAVLLDLQLGTEDGLELLPLLRAERGMARVPVVAFTVHDHRRVEAVDSGVDGFVRKPFRAGALRNALRPHLGTVVKLELGPIATESARTWLSIATGALVTIRQPSTAVEGVPVSTLRTFHGILDSWTAAAAVAGPEFTWQGEFELDLLHELFAQWQAIKATSGGRRSDPIPDDAQSFENHLAFQVLTLLEQTPGPRP